MHFLDAYIVCMVYVFITVLNFFFIGFADKNAVFVCLPCSFGYLCIVCMMYVLMSTV